MATAQRWRLARPQPRLTLMTNIKISMSTPHMEMVGQIRSDAEIW